MYAIAAHFSLSSRHASTQLMSLLATAVSTAARASASTIGRPIGVFAPPSARARAVVRVHNDNGGGGGDGRARRAAP